MEKEIKRQEEDKIKGGRSEEKKGEERGEEIVIKRKSKGMIGEKESEKKKRVTKMKEKNGVNIGFIS